MSMSMEKPLRGAVLRNGLVMLPRGGQHGEAVADARPVLCPLCGLCHAPGHEALLPGAVELLRSGATGQLHSRKLRSFQEVAFQ